ncbi:MAG: tRNA (adenosine(37)-N6)-threonylcarbamoyltransferase complex transferase subunit TsaD [Simkaniaceae bacterium]
MYTLGIESTCDESGASVVKNGSEILSNVISSQATVHAPYGGVFPELASRSHLNDLLPCIEMALLEAKITPDELDLIAVATKPGLLGALLMGLSTAKALSFSWNLPLIDVDHVEAHLFAAMMPRLEKVSYPSLGVVLSGGHTFIALIHSDHTYTKVGSTVDDAIGEAFDKVATLLDLSYPGGPEIEKLAKKGNSSKYSFNPGSVKGKPLDFSFSGLKTNLLYTIKGQGAQKKSPSIITKSDKPHIAAAFQKTAFNDIVDKTLLAAHKHHCSEIYLGGGVTQNKCLRALFSEKTPLPVYWPPIGLSLDNAAMIAGLGAKKISSIKTKCAFRPTANSKTNIIKKNLIKLIAVK